MAFISVLNRYMVKKLYVNHSVCRLYSATIEKGVVLGVYSDKDDTTFKLSKEAENFDEKLNGKVTNLLKLGGGVKAGSCRLLWGADEAWPLLAAVGLGPRDAGYCERDQYDARLENIRVAAGAGAAALKASGVQCALVDGMGDARAAAEGATLATYLYQQYRAKKKPEITVLPLNETDRAGWLLGATGAECQNWARTLKETPGNMLTPTVFAETATQILAPLGVKCVSRDKSWLEKERMFSFLSVAQGSAQPPVLLELHYTHPNAKAMKPIVLVGKGVTFDTGGISLKPSAKMADMRGDMGGAAVVAAALRAAAILKLPLNIVGLIPLTENMPGGRATKPGDVFTARNGKTVLVDNTDAEGRLILADALCYAHDFSPMCTVDLATLTGAMSVTLGEAAAGLFCADATLRRQLAAAGETTGDRLFPMPVYRIYEKMVTEYKYVDVHNVGGGGRGGGSCKAHAFLAQFAPAPHAHIDIASVMADCKRDQPYLHDGSAMSGRPTRTILEFLRCFKPM